MSAYVDELRHHPRIRDPRARRLGHRWCHLFADSLPELHAFAQRIGLDTGWFQDRRLPHYDLTPMRRIAAVQAGAVEIVLRDWIQGRVMRDTTAPLAEGDGAWKEEA